jgi:hypothetical protein
MKKNNIIIDYVMSGAAISFRLGTPYKDLEEGISKSLEHASKYLQSRLKGKILTSGLFNAYTEKKIVEGGPDFRRFFDCLYSDSGGLQLVTQNRSITPEMRREIYRIQATYSDLAFSFDRIPYKKVNGSMLYLGDQICKNFGEMAGRDLKEQISYFEEMGSQTKIFPILHGPTKDGLKSYTYNMFDQLNEDEISKLEAIAAGGLIWTDEFRILERAVNCYQLDIPDTMKPHFHALGIVSPRKLMPVLIGTLNGLLPGCRKFSFDSAKLLKSHVYCYVLPSLEEMKDGKPERILGKVRNSEVEIYYNQLWEFWKGSPGNIFDGPEDLLEHSIFSSKGLNDTQQFQQLGLESGIKAVTQSIFFVYYNTFKFLQVIESYLLGEVELSEFMSRYPKLHLLEELETIDDVEVFKEWYDSVRYSDNGSKISNQKVHYGMDPMKATKWLF